MISVEATDTISAFDLVQRLGRYRARSSPLDGGAQEVVIEDVATGQLQDILALITDWASAYDLESVQLRLGNAGYRLRLDRTGGLSWHEIT